MYQAEADWGENSRFYAALYSEWENKKAYWKPFSLASIFNDPISMRLSKQVFHKILEIKQSYGQWQ